MKQCKGCGRFKSFNEFEQRPDSKDGYRNYCKLCKSKPPKGNSRRVKGSIGDVYGRWTLISRAPNLPDGTSTWNCRCACGTERVIKGPTLYRGESKSCGCLLIDVNHSKRETESIIKAHYRAYKYGAKRKTRELIFDISYSEFKQLIFKNCYYCGTPPATKKYYYNSKGRQDDHFTLVNGIDRLNNKLGYIKSNVVTCCKMCNQMKLDYTLEDFLSKVEQIYLRSIDDRSKEKISVNKED